MATFKEAVASGRAFRFDDKGSWFTYNNANGCLINRDTDITCSDLVTTFKALSDKWTIEDPPKSAIYYRAALMWDRNHKRYIMGRDWFPSQADALRKLHHAIVPIRWETAEFPNLELTYPPTY